MNAFAYVFCSATNIDAVLSCSFRGFCLQSLSVRVKSTSVFSLPSAESSYGTSYPFRYE